MENRDIACVVMAAGAAARFGGGKLLRTLGGRAIIDRALDAVPGERFGQVYVVAGDPAILARASARGFCAVVNDRPAAGTSRTVRLGLEAAGTCGGVLFLAADQPLLRRETVERLIDAFREQPDKIAALAHDGVRGNPCLFPARFFPELLALEGDRGGSAVIRRHQDELNLVEAPAWELMDVDRPEDLQALEDHLRA